jgi:threonine dehydrogenase-like Zn-dependent dehydrogenase
MPLKLYARGRLKIWHYRGTVAGNRLRGSCETTNKAIAARQVAEIEAREWKCSFDGPQAVLTFAQAAALLAATAHAAEVLVTHRFPLERAAEAFRTAADKTSGAIKVQLHPAS